MMVQRLLPLLALLWLLPGGFAGAGRIVAVGDVHGEIDGFDAVLRAAELIDDEGRWIGGDATLVQTGDMTDRGPRVRAVMDRLRSLQQQAPAQGGRVVVTLGNHEVSNLVHLFDEYSTPVEVYRQIWADFAAPNSARRQKAAYRKWRTWQQRYPGCVKEENSSWVDSRDAWLEAHPPGYVEYIEALSPTGEYGAWLRGLEVATEVEGSVFLHGGLSPQLAEQGYESLAEINESGRRAIEQFDSNRERLIDEKVILPFSSLWELACAVFVEMIRLEDDGRAKALARRAELVEIDQRRPGMPGWFLTEENGPLWYRGLATAEEAELGPQLEDLLERFGAQRVVVGHTPQPEGIRSRFGGRVYLIDTAMAYAELGGRAAALEIDGDRVTAIYVDRRLPLTGVEPPAPEGTNGHGDEPLESSNGDHEPPLEGTNGDRQEEVEAAGPAVATDAAEPQVPTWFGPDGKPLPFTTVEEVLEFLAEAKVVRSTSIDVGVTLPRKVLLKRDGVEAHAVFHDVEIQKQRERLRGGQVVSFFRDHYANNVAAFELGRILGIVNIPPAVIRRIGRETGSAQLWIENSRTEADRRRMDFSPPGPWRLTYQDMKVFDNLLNNIDRNQGNILFDGDWNLWFIDHTRSFSRTKQLPSPERVRRCSRRLWKALHALDETDLLDRLRPHLGVYEIRAILARRDLLVELIEQRIAEHGEKGVLFDYDDPLAETDTEDPDVPEAPPPEPEP